MKTKRSKRFLFGSALLLSMYGAASVQAALTLVDNTNHASVTAGEVDSVGQIEAGQTLYVGIPYSGASWPEQEEGDYFFDVSTYLLGAEGSSTASFNFYSATEVIDETESQLTGLTALSGFTAGVVNVAQQNGSGVPSDSGNVAMAGVAAQIGYENLSANPFASLTEGILWLGITNTGENTILYYAGSPFGVPAPSYTFAEPFDTTTNSLYTNTYIHEGGSQVSGNQNVHPYMNVVLEPVLAPEPSTALLAGLAGLSLLRRRRVTA